MDNFIKENYNFIEKLGKGGFGTVYLVTKKNSNDYIALKKIVLQKKDIKESLEDKLEKALLEINILKDIATPECNPNISCYLDHHVVKLKERIVIYLEMEYIQGPTLDLYMTRLEDDRDLWLSAIYISIKGLCLALKSIHEQNIIHQDIKPENIIVDHKTNFPKLVDFGLSCIAKEDKECIYDKCCKSGGTFEFMAPERIREETKVGYPQSDIWSLGATFYYIITGHHNRDTRRIQSSDVYKLDTGIKILDDLINGMTDTNVFERHSIEYILSTLKDI